MGGCVRWRGAHATAWMWKPEDSFVDLVLYFYLYVGSREHHEASAGPVDPSHWPQNLLFLKNNIYVYIVHNNKAMLLCSL